MESSVSAYLQRYMALMVLHLFSEAGRPLKAAVSKLELACYLWLRELTSHNAQDHWCDLHKKVQQSSLLYQIGPFIIS